jgi:hypothetical protein
MFSVYWNRRLPPSAGQSDNMQPELPLIEADMPTGKRNELRCPICDAVQQTDLTGNQLFEVRACEKCRVQLGATRARIKEIEAKALRRLRRPKPPSAA